MNLSELSRPLDISDVDFRVQSINNRGYATILAYKDARVDMNRLDNVLTPMGWQRDYKLIDGKLFCGVGIYNEDIAEWVWKWDVGTESMTEKDKGQASDAFKRACFNLGIGRELYDYPIISVKLNPNEFTVDSGKPRQTYNLKIRDWKWYSEFKNGKISFLAAKDETGTLRFKWGEMQPKRHEPEYKQSASTVDEEQVSNVEVVVAESQIEEKETVDSVRDLLSIEYKKLFGKAPHGRMSTEKMKQEIDAELNKIEEIEEPQEVDEEIDMLMELSQKIDSFTDANEFIPWAKDSVAILTSNNIDQASLNNFKDACNKHYAKIK